MIQAGKIIVILFFFVCVFISCSFHVLKTDDNNIFNDIDELHLLQPCICTSYMPRNTNEMSPGEIRNFLFEREKSYLDYWTGRAEISQVKPNSDKILEFNEEIILFFISLKQDIKENEDLTNYEYSELKMLDNQSMHFVALTLFKYTPQKPNKSPSIIAPGSNDPISGALFFVSLYALYAEKMFPSETSSSAEIKNKFDSKISDGIYFVILDEREKTIIYYSYSPFPFHETIDEKFLDIKIIKVLQGIRNI